VCAPKGKKVIMGVCLCYIEVVEDRYRRDGYNVRCVCVDATTVMGCMYVCVCVCVCMCVCLCAAVCNSAAGRGRLHMY